MRAVPRGRTEVFIAKYGTEANELVFKAAFMAYRRKQRGDASWTKHEQETAMKNQGPGSPDLAILSFNSFHDRSIASLSTTRSKPVKFPQLKYPLAEHEQENGREEELCLQEVEHIIDSWHCLWLVSFSNQIRAREAIIVLLQGLQAITESRGICLNVDEVQTGFGTTGKFWGHEH
ncbi:pyridoxal phosphate-dependent transferase [Aspergillus avenaceus]|uniref:Pyridoxal phosphate-dependent transferase n=1 Tax=Aspergillus avenaceus TaxID=36643 RepID=A0A5N6TEJ8_ASPAV|nr:pyridoxal phosphate-dependent transferase [Aspergillus avenaceus]